MCTVSFAGGRLGKRALHEPASSSLFNDRQLSGRLEEQPSGRLVGEFIRSR